VLAGDLRFSKLSLDDSGMYQCVAENKHGTIYASAELAVQGKGPRNVGDTLVDTQVGAGGVLSFHVYTHTHTHRYMYVCTRRHTCTYTDTGSFPWLSSGPQEEDSDLRKEVRHQIESTEFQTHPISGKGKVNVCCSERKRWQKA
jgi:hypothetical protein